MSIAVTWRTDDLCPACGNVLTATDDGQLAITFTCGSCGWLATWTGDKGTEVVE